MNTPSILKTFRVFRGSGVWASRLLKVPAPTISMWLTGRKPIPEKWRPRLEALANELEDTNGECLKTVRSMRRKK